MNKMKVFRTSDIYLKDEMLSLRAKGFLTLVLTNNIVKGFDVTHYCSDNKEDISDIILELRINKYLKFNDEDKSLEAFPYPYDMWDNKNIEN